MGRPHELLGVPEDAGLDDVKRAYRRLARRHHPDLNPGDPAAAERFRRITDAYLLLSHPGLGPALSRAVGADPGEPHPVDPAAGPGGLHLSLDVPLTLAIAGGSVAVRAVGRRVRMTLPRLAGDGLLLRLPAADPGPPPRDLLLRVRVVVPEAFWPVAEELHAGLDVAPEVATTGGIATMLGPDGHTIPVAIPPGARDGDAVRLAGLGGPVPRRHGERGDLVLRLRVPEPAEEAEGTTWRWREALRRFREAAGPVGA
ncbi:MAG: DnaJ domain-containing protein [Thermoleophilia bacterium]|nr:DnaJ domain-containing protein [Thermoleophilia bacterium]